ncbi:hypothetical protein [Bacteroides sp.]
MNEIWHTDGKPNYAALVVIIDKDNKIVDFGFYDSEIIKDGDRWAYMSDLVNNTIELFNNESNK